MTGQDHESRLTLVSGKVQGVWFRGSTQKQAIALGITGWAKNLPDGKVEVYYHGPSSALDQLERWLAKGPELANVTSVDSRPTGFLKHEGFITG